MKATLTAIALLFAIPGMAIASDNVDEEKLPERAMENPATTGDADATAGEVDAMTAAANNCVDKDGVEEEDLSERAQQDGVDTTECETFMEGDANAGRECKRRHG